MLSRVSGTATLRAIRLTALPAAFKHKAIAWSSG
jgi:hypothetical protein